MKIAQRTISKEFSLSGVGLHTGCNVKIVCKPSAENTGISFIRTDLPGKPVVKAEPSMVKVDSNMLRCTSIGSAENMIHTIEHFMSAMCGAGITNLTVEINNNELPGLDGSAESFFKAVKSAGVVDQQATIEPFVVLEPMGVELKGCSIFILPSEDFKISYTLDYGNTFLKSQFHSVAVDESIYASDIAPARTFCLENEVKELQRLGLGKGANYENTLVFGENGIINNQLRFQNECARHKILDFIGDLYLLGAPIRGHVYAIKSGHTLNFLLLKKILRLRQRAAQKGIVHDYDLTGKKELDINQIMKILPHRYPFLLVDRVVEIEKGKKAVGIKNVTINDQFFRGHFPTKPIMPGVLMVEAMAQTAGVIILTNEAHHGKVAFFLSADKVKFRKQVIPGDQLIMHVEMVRDRSKTAQVHAKAMVEGEIVAEAEMVFSFTDKSFLD